MTQSSSALVFSILMLAAGIGIPVMAALNANLGAQIANPTAAGLILFVVGLVLTSLATALVGFPTLSTLNDIPPIYFIGGILVAFYVLSVTWAAPRIGVGNAVFLVLLGQLASAAIIDHYGFFGATQSIITSRRALGIALIAVGIYLARRVD